MTKSIGRLLALPNVLITHNIRKIVELMFNQEKLDLPPLNAVRHIRYIIKI